MVVAFFLARVDAVGASRVEQMLDAVGAAHEASASHENDGVVLDRLGATTAP